MFYKALGFVIWKLAMRQLRGMVGGYRKPAAAATVAAAVGAIYVATRGDDE
jgi:hypothetical protein